MHKRRSARIAAARSEREKEGITARDVKPRDAKKTIAATKGDEADVLCGTLSFRTACVLLLVPRLFSAFFNLIHDCDETYNYWEPLHYLLYGEGFQTWEYSPDFALRSYLYVIAHYAFAFPLDAVGRIISPDAGKLAAFYGLRCVFALATASTEALLIHALCKAGRRKQSWVFLALLTTSSAMFVSSTSFLPGTFSMYCFTLAAACVLLDRPAAVIVACASSVIVGWSVTAVAALPYALWVVSTTNFLKSLKVAIGATFVLILATAACDSFFYGQRVFSLYNFLMYNVFGSGDSSLYGTEDATFYVRNGLNNLNVLLPLSCVGLLCFAGSLAWNLGKGSNDGLRVAVACSPQWFWLGAITMLPHKEERFMYVVYPLIILAASEGLCLLTLLSCQICAWLGRAFGTMQRASSLRTIFWLAATTGVCITAVLSACRVGALIHNYGAGMEIYTRIASAHAMSGAHERCTVCVGSAWYEFPSSFLLPRGCALAFVDEGFDGVLPARFNASAGGTRWGAAYLNDRNQAHVDQFVRSADACDLMVGLKLDASMTPKRAGWGGDFAVLDELPYVQTSKSPRMHRAFHVPYVSSKHLVYNAYVLHGRRRGREEDARGDV